MLVRTDVFWAKEPQDKLVIDDEDNESTCDSAGGKSVLFVSECLLAKPKDLHNRFST